MKHVMHQGWLKDQDTSEVTVYIGLLPNSNKMLNQPMHTPLRTCAATGQKLPQAQLLRFTNVKGIAMPDTTLRNPGRGVYILPTEAAYLAALKRKVFATRLKTSKPPLPWAEIAAPMGLQGPIIR